MQSENAYLSILVTEFGMIIAVRPQPENKSALIVVIELERVTDVKPLQYINAPSPMLVTELGMVIDAKLEQLWNAE